MERVAPVIVIAAGGAGDRIGGNKPERMLAGRPLVDHALDWARAGSDCLALAVGAGQDRHAVRADLPLLSDQASDLGPIAALHSAFVFASERGRSHVMLVACDMPLLPPSLTGRLSDAIGAAGAAMPASGGFLHPLAGMWRADPDRLRGWIAAGGRALRGFAAEVGLVEVEWVAADPDPFVNVNTPQDLAAVETLLRTRAR